MTRRDDQPRTSDGRFDRRMNLAPSSSLQLEEPARATLGDDAHDGCMPETEWDEYNADGSYSYPPEPINAEQLVAFWRRCPIPDSVLSQVQRSHAAVRQRLVKDRIEKAHPGTRPQERAFSSESKQACAEWDTGPHQAAVEAEAHFPPAPMPAGQVRSIVRAMRAVRQAGDSKLADEEFERVRAEPSGISWAGRDLTWNNVCYHYGRSLYPDWVWLDPAVHGFGKLDRVSQQLADLTETVNRIRDGQDADFLTRGKTQRQAERALRDAGYTKN